MAPPSPSRLDLSFAIGGSFDAGGGFFAPAVSPTTVLLIGQSNAAQGPVPDTFYAGKTIGYPYPTGSGTLYLNGVQLTVYPAGDGCAVMPFLMKAMLDSGAVSPILVVEGAGGLDMDNMLGTQLPDGLAMLGTIGRSAYTHCVFIHGEKDSQLQADADAYRGKLDTFRSDLHAGSSGTPLIVPLVRTTDAATYPFTATTIAAQLDFDADWSDVHTVDGSDLPTFDLTHYTSGLQGGYYHLTNRIHGLM